MTATDSGISPTPSENLLFAVMSHTETHNLSRCREETVEYSTLNRACISHCFSQGSRKKRQKDLRAWGGRWLQQCSLDVKGQLLLCTHSDCEDINRIWVSSEEQNPSIRGRSHKVYSQWLWGHTQDLSKLRRDKILAPQGDGVTKFYSWLRSYWWLLAAKKTDFFKWWRNFIG